MNKYTDKLNLLHKSKFNTKLYRFYENDWNEFTDEVFKHIFKYAYEGTHYGDLNEHNAKILLDVLVQFLNSVKGRPRKDFEWPNIEKLNLQDQSSEFGTEDEYEPIKKENKSKGSVMKNKKENFNFKNIINEELRGMETRHKSSKVSIADTLSVLDEAIENLSMEITSIELVESKSRSAELLKECLNFMNNTRRKLTRL